jgi:multidrug efflux pump subunit AcrB
MLATLGRGFAIALVAVYALLAVPVRSYAQPLLILLAVPFGAAGAVLGHALFRMDITMFTLIGVTGVTGVVVNDALVLLHAIRDGRGAGLAPREALEAACTSRFRPILLTTLTTFLGLTPVLIERSAYAQDLKPMAISLACGEVLSTLAVLLVVPACYALMEDLRGLLPRNSASARAVTVVECSNAGGAFR